MILKTSKHGIPKDRTGMIYNNLTVIAFAGRRPFGKQGRIQLLWKCRCHCGNKTIVSASKLSTTKSCGCLKNCRGIKAPNYQHGYARRPEYAAYNSAHERCTNPNNDSYHDYGGRGIEFRYTSFEQFIADVGDKPNSQLSLDRKNSNGHYEPGNCRWADKSIQAKNKRRALAIQNFSDQELFAECKRRKWIVNLVCEEASN